MAILRELFIKLGLNVDEASFAKGQLAADGVKLGMEKLVQWGKAAAEALVDVAKDAVETAAHLDDTSQAIGVSTDALQELGYAAGQSGVEAGELEQSLRLLSRTMAAAGEGGEEQGKAFAKLGVHVKGADGKLRAADDVIGDIADKLKKMPDGAEKTALSMQLFGKTGSKMVPLLNEGSDGIARMRQEARDLGLVLDENLIKQGAEIDDLATALKAMWKGIKTQVGAALFPDILRTGRAIKEWILQNRKLIQQNMISFFKGLIVVGKLVAELFLMIGRNAKFFFDSAVETVRIVWDLLGALGPLRPVLVAVAAAWVGLLSPAKLLATALAGIVVFIDDFRMFLKYGYEANTLTGQFLKNVDKWMEPKPGDPWWVTALKDFLGMIRETLKAMIELDKMINGTKFHEENDAAAASDPHFRQRQADIATSVTARKRLALGQSLTPAELKALENIRNSPDTASYFSMPTANFDAFKFNTGAHAAAPSLVKGITQANSKVIVNAPVNVQVTGNGDEFLEGKMKTVAEKAFREEIDATIETAAAAQGE